MSRTSWAPTHRHKKRGSGYRMLGVGFLSMENGFVLYDFDLVNVRLGSNETFYVSKHTVGVSKLVAMDLSMEFIGVATIQVSDRKQLRNGEPIVVYQGINGRLWVRSFDQFMDGRFDKLNKPDPIEALNLFREFVIKNATQWKLGSNHHHPMWAHVASALGEDTFDIKGGAYWKFILPENKQTLEELKKETPA